MQGYFCTSPEVTVRIPLVVPVDVELAVVGVPVHVRHVAVGVPGVLSDSVHHSPIVFCKTTCVCPPLFVIEVIFKAWLNESIAQ